MTNDSAKRLELLVIQPTPLCNLDCTYCYLPDRGNTARMSDEVLRRTFEQVFSSPLAQDGFTVVWHAGEPLVVGIEWYERAFALIESLRPATVTVRHAMQTNGTLVTDAWCEFFARHGVCVGVSVDGPAEIHDAKRVLRSGKGTHARVMAGLQRLQAHGLEPHAIAVLSDASLESPDAVFDFFVGLGVRRVGFNVEEAEGKNARGSLDGKADRVRAFFRRVIARSKATPGALVIREVEGLGGAIVAGRGEVGIGQESDPGRILNVDHRGDFTTFSPELLGATSARHGPFALGNVLVDSLDAALEGERLAAMTADIRRGIERCRAECPYFQLCGGGSPSNKHYENGALDSTVTSHCVNSRQAIADALLEAIELDLGLVHIA